MQHTVPCQVCLVWTKFNPSKRRVWAKWNKQNFNLGRTEQIPPFRSSPHRDIVMTEQATFFLPDSEPKLVPL